MVARGEQDQERRVKAPVNEREVQTNEEIND